MCCCQVTCDACVGHVCVHTIPAVPGGPSPRTPRNGLIVAHGAVTKREVVHAALPHTNSTSSSSGSTISQCLQALQGECVALNRLTSVTSASITLDPARKSS
jgi:hypothetical protein